MDLSLYHVLSYAPSCPPSIIKKLARDYTLTDLLAMSSHELQEQGLALPAIHYLRKREWPDIEQDREWLTQPHHHLIDFASPDFPPLLREIPDPPLLLYAIGCKELLYTPQIAIVGTRKPTSSARETARQFADVLAKLGLTITSGLALGIDAASHEGALQAQGKTIAVLGNGLNHYYPRSHQVLQNRIAEQGLLISTFPPNTAPRAEYFPQRNRIISGLSVATLVVEAAIRSGSLITARMAGEQGREVFAMPGSIHNPEARGCHALIKQGAKLIETVDDILEELTPLLKRQLDLSMMNFADEKTPIKKSLTPELTEIYQQIDYSPVPIEVLIERTGKTPDVLFSALMQLELGGYIASSPAGYVLCS